MNKKGLSSLVSTVLIVMLALVAVAIVWGVIRSSLTNTGGELESQIDCFNIDVQPTKCEYTTTTTTLTVTVKKGEVDGFIGVVEYTDETAASNRSEGDLPFLGSRQITLANNAKTPSRAKAAALLVDQNGELQNCELPTFSILCTSTSGGGTPTCPGGCDDSNECTTDVCNAGACAHTAVSDGQACGANSLYTCQSGTCQATGNLRVFTTATTHAASGLNGLSGADSICNNAAAGVLPGTYRAWLSNAGTDARDRIPHTTGNFIRADNVVVANGWTDLIDGTLDNPIDRDHTGAALPNLPPPRMAITGTSVNGIKQPGNTGGLSDNGYCNNNWDVNSGTYVQGNYRATDSSWSSVSNAATCDTVGRLICIQVAP